MRLAALVLVALIALLHLYIAWFEIFAWETRGPVVFAGFEADLFQRTVAMAANQGLYNGFLAAGLIWALVIRDLPWQRRVATCFLLFVAVAGLFGAATVSPRIAMVQTVPAILALVLLHLSARRGHA